MDTFREDALYLALDKFADIDAVARADFDERFVPFGIELRADVLAVEGHYGKARWEYVVSSGARYPSIMAAGIPLDGGDRFGFRTLGR